MANEAKQFTIGGVTHDVMDVGARQLIADLQTAIDAITSGDTTTAIKTFQEVINFLDGVTDDATLIGKLNELRTLINAKYSKPASGIPASDLADGVIPDVSGFATKTEVDDKVANAGKVKSVTINGIKKLPNEQTGDVDLGTVQGQKGDKGDTGNVEITDAGEMVALIVNDLTTGGAGNFLSAEMGKRLKQKIDDVQANIVKLYNKLGNMAFWDAADQAAAEPTELDWSIPKHRLAVTNNNANAKVYRNGAEVTSALNIEENATVELVVAPVGDYIVTGVTPSTGTAIDLGDGTFKVVLTMGNTDIALTLTVSTTATYSITVNGHVTASGATRIVAGGTATVNLAADQGYALPTDASGITISGATITSYTPSQDLSTAVLVIGSASGAVAIGVLAEEPGWSSCPTSDVMNGSTVTRYGIARGTVSTSGEAMDGPRSSNVMMSPKLKTSNQAGDSAAYFFPTNRNGKVTVKATLPADIASNFYFGVNLVYYNSGFSFIRRDTYQYLNNGVTEVTFTIPSNIVANVSYIKILFALYKAGTNNTASSLEELDTLLAELDNGEYKFKMFNE